MVAERDRPEFDVTNEMVEVGRLVLEESGLVDGYEGLISPDLLRDIFCSMNALDHTPHEVPNLGDEEAQKMSDAVAAELVAAIAKGDGDGK